MILSRIVRTCAGDDKPSSALHMGGMCTHVDLALMNRRADGRDEVINEAINKLSRAATINFCRDGKERRRADVRARMAQQQQA